MMCNRIGQMRPKKFKAFSIRNYEVVGNMFHNRECPLAESEPK